MKMPISCSFTDSPRRVRPEDDLLVQFYRHYFPIIMKPIILICLYLALLNNTVTFLLGNALSLLKVCT